MGWTDAERIQLGDGGEPSAALPAHPRKLPASVCYPETATAKTSVSTVSGPKPLQTPGIEDIFVCFANYFIMTTFIMVKVSCPQSSRIW